MRRFVPVLAAMAMGVSATAMAAGTYTTAEPGVLTSTTVVVAPDDSGVLTSTPVIGTFDSTLAEKFEVEREIVDRAAAVYGVPATFATGGDLPPAISDMIVEGNIMPPAAPVRPVPAALGDLPTFQGGEWVATGDHLVEVMPDGRIAMVVYDVLP